MLKFVGLALGAAVCGLWPSLAMAQGCYGGGGMSYTPSHFPGGYGYTPGPYFEYDYRPGPGFGRAPEPAPLPPGSDPRKWIVGPPPPVIVYRSQFTPAYSFERRYTVGGRLRFESYRAGPGYYSAPAMRCGPGGCFPAY